MTLLALDALHKSFGAAVAVDGVSLTVHRGEIVCLLGPSGCGKTTLLRLVAGLEEPDSGSISFDGRSLDGVPPRDRGFGLMFQDLALFPHMDVLGNVSFGLRMQKHPKDEAARRVERLLEMVDLAGFGRRKVHQLSGGERQRVALARSLAPGPRLLMLDEPLGSLDRSLRESLQVQVRSILKEVGVTAIYVTHDRDEAFAMSDRMVVMERGAVVQAGAPEDMFRAPASELVARSLGLRNAMPGTMTRSRVETRVECALGALVVDSVDQPAHDGRVLVLIDERRALPRPAADARGADPNHVRGVVESRRFHAGEIEVLVRVGPNRKALACLLQPDSANLSEGDQVSVTIPPDAIRLIAAR